MDCLTRCIIILSEIKRIKKQLPKNLRMIKFASAYGQERNSVFEIR